MQDESDAPSAPEEAPEPADAERQEPAEVTQASVGPRERAEPVAQRAVPRIPLGALPTLGLLAVLAAALDLALNRVAVRAMAELSDPDVVLAWQRAGTFPRNVAGVSGLGALAFALVGFLAMPGFAPVWVRLPVAAFAGVLTPMLTLATFLPRERMQPQIILFGLVAAQVLGVVLAANALTYRDRALRATAAFALTTCLTSTVVVIISTIRALAWSDAGGTAGTVLRHFGEVCWLLLPVVALAGLVRWKQPRDRIALATGAVVALALISLAIAGEGALHPHYRPFLYGAFRLALLPESAAALYALPLALGLGGAVAGLLCDAPTRRQLGGAVILWIAGGYAGRSPIQLLYAVLSILLIARAAQALDPEGVRRARLRWTPQGLQPPPGET